MTTELLITFPDTEAFNYGSDSSISFESLPAIDPVQEYSNEANTDVQLEVAGNSFVLNTRDFQKLAALPWQRIHGGAFRMEGASPEAFAGVVNYVLYGELPKRKKMGADEKEELRSMAQKLNMSELMDHMASKRKGSGKAKSAKIAPAPRKKRFGGLFGCSCGKEAKVEKKYGYTDQRERANTFTTY